MQVDVHVLTRNTFAGLFLSNPNVSKVWTVEKFVDGELLEALRDQKFEYCIDLHKNWRSMQVCWKLRVKTINYSKQNIQKWLKVRLKSWYPFQAQHIVDRYFESLKPLKVGYDGGGLEYFFDPSFQASKEMLNSVRQNYIVGVLGAAHATKQIPYDLLKQIIGVRSSRKIVLLGGKDVLSLGQKLSLEFDNVIDMVGKCSLDESAFWIKHSQYVISPDTGLMHMAAAFDKPILSICGSTSPAFGMYPYFRQQRFHDERQVVGLACRPCSKIGFAACPKGHFKCMLDQKADLTAFEREL